MFICDLCKSSFSRRDGAWRLKLGSQAQVKEQREPLSLAAPTRRKQSQGGKTLSLFASLLLLLTPASNATNVQKVLGKESQT